MNINFQLTKSDFLAYHLYSASTSILHKKRRFRSRVVVPIIYMLFGLYMGISNEDPGIVILFSIIAILWFVYYPKYSKWRYEKFFSKYVEQNHHNQVDKPVKVSLHENSLSTKDSEGETQTQGSELEEIVETQDHFYLILSTETSLIFPKASIKNKEKLVEWATGQGANYVNELDWTWK